jgi:hypothetical protein
MQGVQDYIFHFVEASHVYGEGARYFLDKFYKNHKRKDVNSLEGLIAFLFGEVKQGGVVQIREIIIVAHGNAQQLLFPLVNGASLTNFKKYLFLSPGRLMALQDDFLDGEFADFNDKRKEVITHLKDDSWITIRACNFGQSVEGMYAVYSFFGGRANVYAPALYQQFNWGPIEKGMRYETRFKVHEHLVKQRFFHRDIHTPDRKEAVVKAIVDPAKFSIPVTLATRKVSDLSSDNALQYEEFKKDLNKPKITEFLKKGMNDAQMQLTDSATMIVLKKDSSWVVNDSIKLEEETFKIEYDLSEQNSDDILHDDAVLIKAEARLRKVPTTNERFPYQLFIDETENKEFKGMLFFLVTLVEEADKQKFDDVVKLLNQGGTAGTEIKELFKNASRELTLELSDTATITKKQGQSWLINDTTPYFLKSERAPTSDRKKIAQVISVYKSVDEKSNDKRQLELLASPVFGKDANLPGTELLAYLDRFSLTELQDLIDHLRNPYEPQNVIYLFHAINAAGRKNQVDQAKWLDSLTEIKQEMMNNPLARNPYTELSLKEQEDYVSDVYDFDVNACWIQVKALNPSSKILPDDLFTDEMLLFPDDFSDSDDSEPDSSSSSYSKSEAAQAHGKDRYVEVSKLTVDVPPIKELDCKEYAEILAKIKALNTTDADEIIKELEDEEHTLRVRDYIYRGTSVLNFTVELMEGFGTFAHSSIGIVSKLGHFVEGTLFEVFALALPIAEAIILTLEVFEAEAESAEAFEKVGKRVAVRQWAKLLRDKITFKVITHFPEKLQLEPQTASEVDPYYIVRYRFEQIDTFGVYFDDFGMFAEDLERGFNEGWLEIEKIGNEVLEKVDDIFDEFLKEGGLDSCKVTALRNSGLIDMDTITGVIMLKFAEMVIEKTSRKQQSN